MTITQVEQRSVGRPQAQAKTIRIQPSGAIRLSPDLGTAKTYEIAVDIEKRYLIIKPNDEGEFKLYYTSPKARSGLLYAAKVFDELGIPPEKLAGEYEVRPLKVEGFLVEL